MAKLSNLHLLHMICSVLVLSCYNVQCLDKWCDESQWLVICVTNHAERTCQQPSNITTNLSGIYGTLSELTCIKLYFVGGLHSLAEDLSLEKRNANVVIGAADPQTTIDCGPNCLFFQTYSVLIFNLLLTNCSAKFLDIFDLTVENVTIQLNNLIGMIATSDEHAHETAIHIINCQFLNNTSGHMRINYFNTIYITKSYFGHGTTETDNESGVEIFTEDTYTIIISDSIFHNNSRYNLKIVSFDTKILYCDDLNFIMIMECIFTESPNGIYIYNEDEPIDIDCFPAISISDSNFSRIQFIGIIIRDFQDVQFEECKWMNNSGTAISIKHTHCIDYFVKEVLIKNSTFDNHAIGTESYVIKVYSVCDSNDLEVTIHDSQFTNNHAALEDNNTITSDCSIVHTNSLTLTVNNVSFAKNNCTGILLSSTTLKIGSLYFIQNHARQGGALQILDNHLTKKSSIVFYPNASLHCLQNRVTGYGGVLYSDESCSAQKKDCFFQFELMQTYSPTFYFTGNYAKKGGHIFFGGCLSGCHLKNSTDVIDLNDADNIFWKLISLSPEDISQSTFAEHPNQVAFCSADPRRPTCTDKHDEITVYRGGSFSIELMVTGDTCFPSYNIIHASITQEIARGVEIRKGENYKEAKPYCDGYTFTLQGGQGSQSHFTIDMELDFSHKQLTNRGKITHLTINYINQCPAGFHLDKNKDICHCISFLESRDVECIETDYSFRVPALTWVGMWHDQVAVKSTCQYCKASGVHTIANMSNSEGLCVKNRTAILCGQCIKGHSIKLGGYTCGDCKKFSYQGYLLTLFFIILGFILVITLLKLNLTISTGLMNSLIFYSNIVYSNHSVFLPLDRDTNNGHLNNAVQFLVIFKAWLNLDFGFDLCYFHGTDTYILTWLQFVFPIYIWLIILAIIVSSRYSTRISKFTGHNTISVLATLMLLSYTKLLLAVFSALSYTQLDMEDQVSYPLWAADANIRYASGKHVWLFLMSVFMIVVYIIPFTLLVCLGPLLISKSNYKVLQWTHKIRPLFDAFCGPYTKTYYYWPGILLLLRIVLVCIIAFYSTGEGSFIVLSIMMAVVFLLLLWLLIGKTHQVSLHRKKKLNLLELFFVINLISFVAISLYLNLKYPRDMEKQQALAVVMVGSVFIVFCCIVAYHVFSAVRFWTITKKIMKAISSRKSERERETAVQQQPLDGDSLGTYYNNRADKKLATQTVLELSQCKNELREPLLEASHD